MEDERRISIPSTLYYAQHTDDFNIYIWMDESLILGKQARKPKLRWQIPWNMYMKEKGWGWGENEEVGKGQTMMVLWED